MAPCAADSIPEVWRRRHPTRDEPEPTDSASCRARRRLGVAPLRHPSLEVARPMAAHPTEGASDRAPRPMGLDGTAFDLPDAPEDARTSGRPATGRAEGASPRVRLLAPCEPGTHAIGGRAIEPTCQGEPSRVAPPLGHLGPGLLLIRDRGPFSDEPIRSVCERGARPLARVGSNAAPRPVRRPADGSYPAGICPGEADRRRGARGLPVRVIACTHDDPDPPGAGERHRPIADLTDPERLPAHEAPPVDPERWGRELAFDEVEAHPGGRVVPIRSRTPAGVVQGACGLVPAHDVVRRVMHDAAVVAGRGPDRLSSIDSSRELRCPLPESPAASAATWYQGLRREVRRQVLRPRRDGWHARVIKREMSDWPKKRPEHRDPPRPTETFREAVVLII
jgi:hypothetical protein